MTVSIETRLALLDLGDKDVADDLQQLVEEWSTRCDRLSAHVRKTADPFTLPIPAQLSPLRAFAPCRTSQSPANSFSLRLNTKPEVL